MSNQKCPLMFCRAGQDFYGSQLFGSSFIFEPLQHGFGTSETSSRPMNASSELRPALLFGSRCRRCPNRWIDRFWFQPDHAAAVHTAISELQSLQSGRSASIATRPPYDNLKRLPAIADSLLSVQDQYN